MRVFLLCLFAMLATPALAQIYKSVDASGHVTFSSQPPVGKPSETIELQPTNSLQATPVPAPTTDASPAPSADAVPYSVLELGGLPDDDALRANNGSFSVSVNIQPDLRPGDSLHLLLDGNPYGDSSTSLQLPLNNIERGEHTLAVEVLNGSGQSVQQSSAISFGVQRVHVGNQPGKASGAGTPGQGSSGGAIPK